MVNGRMTSANIKVPLPSLPPGGSVSSGIGVVLIEHLSNESSPILALIYSKG